MSASLIRPRQGCSDEDILEQLSFDPTKGTVIRQPGGRGYGHWVGGHKVAYDKANELFYLFYRNRTPLEAGRGGDCAVAVSGDGQSFEDVWTATKDELCSNSIEVGCPVVTHDGKFRLYLSYEYAYGRVWRIDVLEADAPEQLHTQSRRTVLTPGDFGLEFLKDPVVDVVDGGYRLYAAVSPRVRFTSPTPGVRITAGHESTMLFESKDGIVFTTGRFVFEPGGAEWESHKARINSVFSLKNEGIAFYDGARSTYDMYEESCGVARTGDGVNFQRIALDAPFVRSPFGCVRYVQGLVARGKLHLFYEFCREDGSHDLRVSVREIA